jgi:multidrug efflux system outer membrane protein
MTLAVTFLHCIKPVACACAVAALVACANTGAPERAAREARESLTPTQPWRHAPSGGDALRQGSGQAPSRALPHDGRVASIARWWQHFDDPLLATLIDEAQAAAPSVVIALARVREAQAQAVAAGAAALPSLGLAASSARGATVPTFVASTQSSALAQAQWEVDLFAGLAQQRQAAASRAEQSRLDWHDARITLAAEVAQTYVNLRSCEALVAVLELSLASQRKNFELTSEKARVGFEAPANVALAEAAAADAANRAAGQRADCDALTLGLTTLTGRALPQLREALAPRQAQLPQPAAAFEVDNLPAQVLAARPDVAAAEQALIAAHADLGAAEAARWPRLVLAGSIGPSWLRVGGSTLDGTSWSIVPTLSLPIFDAGRIAAGVDAAAARRDAAYAALDARIRTAVREVEEALVRLAAARVREADATRAATGFRGYFEATEQRWRLGAASLIEMEDARRLALNAQAALLALQRERVAAWVSLYRAVGGGWRPDDAATAQAAPVR